MDDDPCCLTDRHRSAHIRTTFTRNVNNVPANIDPIVNPYSKQNDEDILDVTPVSMPEIISEILEHGPTKPIVASLDEYCSNDFRTHNRSFEYSYNPHGPTTPPSIDTVYNSVGMESINDSDPVIQHFKELSTLSPQQNQQSLTTISEGYDEDNNQITGYNDYHNPFSSQDSKRYKGRRSREDRKHKAIMRSIASSKGIYRAHIQHDPGANVIITNNKESLLNFRKSPLTINGCNSDGPALKCLGYGYLPWYSKAGDKLLLRCYYSSSASGTIISPQAIVQQYRDLYSGWEFRADEDSKCATLHLLKRNDTSTTSFDLFQENLLWFHYHTPPNAEEITSLRKEISSVCNSLSSESTYLLWHNRLGHPGTRIMDIIHNHVVGIPKLRANKFFRCGTCLHSKFRKKPIGKNKSSPKPTNTKITQTDPVLTPSTQNPDRTPAILPGDNLYCDFGFMRGSDWSQKDEVTGKLVTSIDGMRSYFLMVDEATRYLWVFLTSSKVPPIEMARGVLRQFEKKPGRTLRCDQGGELGRSGAFGKMVHDEGYLLQTTGAYSSAQNGLAEKPNQDLAAMVRSLLHGAGLGSEYWSYALRHAVYLKNRLPHSSLKWSTPYEQLNGRKPNLSHLKIFGSRVHAHSGPRGAKLDSNNVDCTFMTYSATDKNIWTMNNRTNKPMLATHYTFDEAHMSNLTNELPPYALALQRSGYNTSLDTPPSSTPNAKCILKYTKLSDHATEPTRSTPASAGLDLYSSQDVTFLPGTITAVPTDLAVEFNNGSYGQIQPRSGLALHKGLFAVPGVIDQDYRGHLKVLILNTTSSTITLTKGSRVAQIISHQIQMPTPTLVENLSSTTRGCKGFGSTGVTNVSPSLMEPTLPIQTDIRDDISDSSVVHVIPLDDNDDHNHNPIVASLSEMLLPYSVHMSSDIYDNIFHRDLELRRNHPTEGLHLILCPTRRLPLLINCVKGTAASKLKNWRSTIKNAYILEVNGLGVQSVEEVEEIFKSLPQETKEISIKFGSIVRQAMHPDHGIPMLYHDQLNSIATRLRELRYPHLNGPSVLPTSVQQQPSVLKLDTATKIIKAMFVDGLSPSCAVSQGILPKGKKRKSRLTRRVLQKQDDWNDWHQSEFKQLDQYEQQNTFGPPNPLPPDANCLSLLWTYILKDDGTKKARCVCNGRPSDPNTVTWGHTYAKALDHVGHRIFWSAIAHKNFIVRGSDASNAFAEAPPPKHPLYVKIDQQFREWWKSKGRGAIPEGYVLKVQKALQGHPESPRLWATLIHTILIEHLGLKPTTHEECLYHGYFNGKEVLFLRQVDDFSCGAEDESIAISLIQSINEKLKIEVKDLGMQKRFNGVDVDQTKYFIKLHCKTYIKKIIGGHTWLSNSHPTSRFPIPMKSEAKFSRQMENAVAPVHEKEKRKLEKEMNINFRQVIGELLYAMVTCRPDISFPVIKLSQYSQNPAQEHYEAAKCLLQYLNSTKEDGIYYWRSRPQHNLPSHDLPSPKPDDDKPLIQPCTTSGTITAAADSDWASDTTHRRSVTGLALLISGGVVLYKSKFQKTVALSSTEAEFAAACEAGKHILYVRSILEEIGMPQHSATPLFIDNNGALQMANAKKPTARTRHVDVKQFALLDWVESDLMELHRITSADNYTDGLTKPLGRILHYRHFDRLMGRYPPPYAEAIIDKTLLQ